MTRKARIALDVGTAMLFVAGALAVFEANRWLSAISPPPTDPLKSALSLRTPRPPPDERPAEPFKWTALAAILLAAAGFAAIVAALVIAIARLMPRALRPLDAKGQLENDAPAPSQPDG